MVSKKAQQFRLNSGKLVTVNAFRRLSEARQIEVMRSWFYQNFSDPIELPYNSAEGGYQWIWGGPFDAREELESEFGGIVKQVALEELVSELEHENGEWSGNPDDYVPDDDDYLFLSGYDSSPKDMLDISLNQIEEAAKLQLAGLMQVFVHKLLFANAISSLETYLADSFQKTVQGNPHLIQRFVETFPGMKEQRILLSAASKVARNLEKRVINELSKVIWHHLDKVNKIYSNTLDISFPDDLNLLKKCIQDRHDIVHRNGKKADGTMGWWDRRSITEAVTAVRALAGHIESKLSSLPTPKSQPDLPKK